MNFIQGLYRSDINPTNNKSRTLPILNITDKYGRTFHLSWIGFFVAFLSWFAFPPLIHSVIQQDLQLTQAQIANSNIIGLLATFLTRLVCGSLCDRYGPRYTLAGCLLAGAIPTAFVPLISSPSGLLIIRFFIGILGGTFVPCQVWITQFFDKNIIGLANALAAGWGNAGGGATFFLMPAIVSSLVHDHGLSPHWAWRVAFPICPLTIIICVTVAILFFGHDTPTGSWNTRHTKQEQEDVNLSNNASEQVEISETSSSEQTIPLSLDLWRIVISPQTSLVALPYLCSFGSELAVEGVISDFYVQTAKARNNLVWNSQVAGNWAAMFGLLNIFTRPLGGYISDVLYRYHRLPVKKWWLVFLGIMQGIFFIAIGLGQFNIYPLIGMMTVLAIFMEAANGAIFSLVPSIHPKFNGAVSGITGASGNMGGIFFGLTFRFLGTDYHKAMWIIGICCCICNLAVFWIPVKRVTKI